MIDVLYEIITIIVAVVIIGALSIKLYFVGVKADSSLPKSAPDAQKILVAVEAIVQYLMDNHVAVQEILNELNVIITALAALGVDVIPLRNDIIQYQKNIETGKS